MFKKVGRLSKSVAKHRVDILVLGIDGLPDGPLKEVRIVVARQAKVQYTQLSPIVEGMAQFDEALSLILSMYKDKKNGYEAKDYSFKVQVRAGSAKMVTIGKANVNLAQYATLDASNHEVAIPIPFKVGAKGATGTLRCQIACSIMSQVDMDGMTDVSGMSGMASTVEGYNVEQDLEGFETIQEEADPEPASRASPFGDEDSAPSPSASAPSPSPPPPPIEGPPTAAPEMRRSKSKRAGSEPPPPALPAVSVVEYERLKRENVELKGEVGNLMAKAQEMVTLRRAFKRQEEELRQERDALKQEVAGLEADLEEEALQRREVAQRHEAELRDRSAGGAAGGDGPGASSEVNSLTAERNDLKSLTQALTQRCLAAEGAAANLREQLEAASAASTGTGAAPDAAAEQAAAARLQDLQALLADEQRLVASLESQLREREGAETEAFMQNDALSKHAADLEGRLEQAEAEAAAARASEKRAAATAERQAATDRAERDELTRQIRETGGGGHKEEEAVLNAVAAKQASYDALEAQYDEDMAEAQAQLLEGQRAVASAEESLATLRSTLAATVAEKRALQEALQEASDEAFERHTSEGAQRQQDADRLIGQLAEFKLGYAELAEKELRLRRELYRMKEHNTVLGAKATKMELLFYSKSQSPSHKAARSGWFFGNSFGRAPAAGKAGGSPKKADPAPA